MYYDDSTETSISGRRAEQICPAARRAVPVVSASRQEYSYSQMARDMKILSERYRGKICRRTVGMSEDGRAIYAMILGTPGVSCKLLVTGAIHGREYMTSLLCMRQMEYYLEHFHSRLEDIDVGDLLQRVSIHYVPMVDPDGVLISQSGYGAIRKTSLRGRLDQIGQGPPSLWKANARGVDLNRNLPVGFQISGRPGPEGYSGPEASSESETKVLIRYLDELEEDGRMLGVINYHAAGSVIFGDHPGSGSVAERTAQMYDLARGLTGYDGALEDHTGMAGRGNLREYLLYRRSIPCITIEIGQGSCPVPIREFGDIWKRNRMLVLREADLLYRQADP